MYLKDLSELIKNSETFEHIGKIENIVGMSIEASGIKASIGDINVITSKDGKRKVMSEVVGFKGDKTILMPYDFIEGMGSGDFVRSTKNRLRIPVGEFLCGRTINAMGEPIDGMGSVDHSVLCSVENNYINPLSRPPITERIHFGIKAIDGFLTVGKGQRIGIFAGSGVGKSTLLGMIAKQASADINVIALVGERGREVKEFIERDLGPAGMARSVLVVATSDQPAVQRAKCPVVATAIAEYFKDQGKDVLLMMDSLTRFAMAQREIGLAVGEPPEDIPPLFMQKCQSFWKEAETLRMGLLQASTPFWWKATIPTNPLLIPSGVFWTGILFFRESLRPKIIFRPLKSAEVFPD